MISNMNSVEENESTVYNAGIQEVLNEVLYYHYTNTLTSKNIFMSVIPGTKNVSLCQIHSAFFFFF